jgi:hypothetical protein
MAFDRRARASVVFGGIRWGGIWGAGVLASDTWELCDGEWSRSETLPQPPGRIRGAMVYDSRRHRCLLFGGIGGGDEHGSGALDDTWLYANGRWRQWRPESEVPRPGPRYGHVLAFDEQIGAAVLFGGAIRQDLKPLADTWLFARGAWHPVPGPGPPGRRNAAFAYDPDLGGCLLHGGSEDDDNGHPLKASWLFRELRWTRLLSPFDTESQADHGLAYHEAAKRLIMFGGLARPHGLLARKEAGWRPIELRVSPPRHQCAPLVWDDELDGLVYHGGEVSFGGQQLDTTWALRLRE